ncbi:MAG: hypothetical protein JXM69_15220 [Anaerolineae bacterium]|nr:hypothetical protein [Anaerolineae bacterium]
MTTRKTPWFIKLAGLLWLLSLALFAPAATAQQPSPPDSPSPFDPRFGIADSFVNIAEANAAGVGWTRVFFRWDVVQPAGDFDWKPTNVPDTFLNAEIAAGRDVVAVLIGTPAWATPGGTSTAVPPMESWGDFVYKIATQYNGRIKHWVIWNQPDITDPNSPSYTWAGSEEDYYRLLKEAYLKIKAVNPEMQVHLAGLTYTWDYNRGNRQYLARLLDIIQADPQAAGDNYYFDAVSYHVYYSPRQVLDVVSDIRNLLNTYGLGHKPVWVNETNAPPSEDYIEPVAAPGPFKITLEEQSAFVIQAFAMGLAGGAERVAFFKMRNERAETPYGLLRSDDSRRPAFTAFQVVTTHFAGTQNATWQQESNIYIVTLDRGGQTTTVLWNMATAPTMFTLNAIAPQALLIDERGNEQLITASGSVYTIALPGAFCSNKSNCFIGGAPRVLVETGSPNQRAPQLPALTLTATPTPSPLPPTDTPTPTPPLPPTLTPTLAPLSPEDEIMAESTPAASPDNQVTSSETAITEAPPAPAAEAPQVIAALPDPGVGDSLSPLDTTGNEPETIALTPVPPVTFSTVMTPRRILWLLVIGLIVFVVAYGVQVVIWYRVRR